ncbi:ankyrin repeat-containing domain protein, partial [Clohesyomyces aquaticus]
SGNLRLVDEVLKHDTEKDVKNIYGETPLHYASISRSAPLLKLLCESGDFVDAQTKLYATPIRYAILAFAPKEAIQIFEKVLQKAVHKTDAFGHTLLHHAAMHGNRQICEILLDLGANVNA